MLFDSVVSVNEEHYLYLIVSNPDLGTLSYVVSHEFLKIPLKVVKILINILLVNQFLTQF